MSEPGADSATPDQQVPPVGDDGVSALDLARELTEAKAQVAQHRDQLLRAAAELENIRKRAARDVEQAHRYALEKFAQELLAVRDSLELGTASAATVDAASLVAGQDATLKLLVRAFEKFAINGIEPVGEPFDPQRHEAMAMQDAPAAEPDSVLHVVQKGYELNGRLLRPARVIVARSPAST
jgi:molecular chaperone GrpE